jgi:ABC-type antimicrobial peptide transport system permease subunit
MPGLVIANFIRELRYSARSFARTPVWTLSLVLTIALGIGSSASVDGFVRGLAAIDTGGADFADGMARIARLLRVAAMAVFVMACANIASFLLSRATARARETAVRVAVGASRLALVRQVLADSVMLSIAGALAGALFGFWIGRIVPATLFDQDADQMIFRADPAGVALVTLVCAVMVMACGLLPLIETRHGRPNAIIQRENSGPSRLSVRINTGLVIIQMTACTVLVIAAGLLLSGFQSALRTSTGRSLSQPVLATVEAKQMSSKSQEANAGYEYFEAIARAARETIDAFDITWVATLPGSRPNWKSFEFESPDTTHRAVEFERVSFTSRTIGEIVLPPIAGRMFGPFDTGACTGVVLSRAAAVEVGGNQVVGRSIELPSGDWAEVIGVVVPIDEPSAARVYHYTPDADEAVPPQRGIYRIPQLTAQQTTLDVNVFAPNYFAFMGLPVVAGATFDDRQDNCRVAVVNREAADRYFNGNAVGGAIIDAQGQRSRVIGVVQSPRLRITQRSIEPAVYFPMSQNFQARMSMIAETNGVDQGDLDRLLRRIKLTPGGREDPMRPPIATRLDDHLSRTALAPERIATVLVIASAAIALLLGMLGLYGVMSDAARRRQREFALRIALGAQGGHVAGQVMVEGMRLVAVGTVAGVAGSFMVARWLAQIAPTDGLSPLVWLTAPVLLALAVVTASVIPARAAAASDPLLIMKDDR